MMKKLLILLSIFIFLIVALPAESANLYWRNCLTGGGDCLDGIDGASLADGDGAFVIRDNSGTYEGYIYRLEDTAETESSPDVISPDANAGNKRWRLVNFHAIGFTGPLTGNVTGNVTGDVTGGATKGTLADASYVTWPAAAVSASKEGIQTTASDGTSRFVESSENCIFGGTNIGSQYECKDILTIWGLIQPTMTSGDLTTGHIVLWDYSGGMWKMKAGDLPITDNTKDGDIPIKSCSGEPEVCTMEAAVAGTDYAAPNADTTGTASKLPVNEATDASGEESVDSTSGQYRNYDGTRQNVFSPTNSFSIVIPAPADTDDINILKAPYGMTILGIDCIVQGTTSVTGQIQECSSAGASCADLDSDITCDADGAADDGTLTDSAIATGAWLRWKTTSVSGTPTFLTVTVRYRVVAD
jgi:hypothetical protein